MMRQNFAPQELADHFTPLPAEQELLANKTGANRLGFVVLLKYLGFFAPSPEKDQFNISDAILMSLHKAML